MDQVQMLIRVGQVFGGDLMPISHLEGRRCAVTGERTFPVLRAVHIQAYLKWHHEHVFRG